MNRPARYLTCGGVALVLAIASCNGSTPPGAGPGHDAGGPSTDGGDGPSWDATEDVPFLGNVDAAPACLGLECQQTACSAGATTTVSGTVYAPNGVLPLYNVIVYVPNGPLEPLAKGITCDQCGTIASGSPLVTALSDATGKFVLKNVPVGQGIPLVVQLGKWRRQTIIPEVKACIDNPLTDPGLTRLPRNQKEGSMPHIALTTGDCDSLGCMLPKIGIDPIEFGVESDGYAKAINVYSSGSDGLPNTTQASTLWRSPTLLKTYDMGIFSCECNENPSTKGTYGDPSFKAVTEYMNQGGRIFTTDYQYTWYRYSPDPNLGALSAANLQSTGIGTVIGGAPGGDNPLTLDTSFPKGKALADWLGTVFPVDAGNPYGQVTCDSVFDNIGSLNAKPQTWASSSSSADPAQPPGNRPRVFTVNTPVAQPVAQQCGKGVHIDAHITAPSTTSGGDVVGCGTEADGGTGCYPDTCGTPLKEDEAMFAFFFFDLASCIQSEGQPPKPPPPK